MKREICRIGLALMSLFMWGCGATWQDDLDVIGFPEVSAPLEVQIGGNSYDLEVGDRMELQNIAEQDPNAPGLKLGGPTCITIDTYLGITGAVLVRTGYDDLAENSDGSKKYSDALHTYAAGVTKYQLRLIRSGQTETFDIPYHSGVIIPDLGAYKFRAGADHYSALALGKQLDLPNGQDRTICFAYQKFAKFEVDDLADDAVVLDEPPIPPDNFADAPIDIPEVPENQPPAENPGDAADPTGGSGGGCSLSPTQLGMGAFGWIAVSALSLSWGLRRSSLKRKV